MLYLVYITDQIHHLTNESKKLIFAYNSEYIYMFAFFYPLSFKKRNKLNKYINTYFFIIPIIP